MEDLHRKIFASLEANEFIKADTDMSLLCSMMISEELTSQSIDAYINLFFTKDASVYIYINKMIKEGPSRYLNEFQSLQGCMQVIYTLLNNFPKEMNDYINGIINMCLIILTRDIYSKFTKLKQKCAEIQLLILTSPEIELSSSQISAIFKLCSTCLTNDKSTINLAIHIQVMAALSDKVINETKPKIAKHILKFIEKIPTNNSQSIIQGGYLAANKFMSHSMFSIDELEKLYAFAKRDVVFKDARGRRQGSRSVVEFIAKHADKFGLQLQCDIDEWKPNLQLWFMSSNRDDAKAGYEALVSVHKAILHTWAQSNQFGEQFKSILNESKAVLEKNHNDNETKLAIYTLGFIAPSAATFLTPREFRDLFLFLLQRIEYLIFVKANENANVLTANSCDYVEAISPFLEKLQSTTDVQQHMNQFKRVTIILIKMFPNVLQSKHVVVVKTLKNMLVSLSRSFIFHDFVEDVVKQAVIWTCSHSLAQEVEILDQDAVTYKSYLPLWKGILSGDKEDFDKVQTALWDQLIKNLLSSSDKLNFKVVVKEFEATDASGEELTPEKTNDFIMFANLSDFYCDLLAFVNPKAIKPWLYTLSDHLIRKSTQLPLVSGFYKLLASTMKLFDEVDYFNAQRVAAKEHVRVTFENVKNYLSFVLKKVHRFKNDLQLSCVLLILRMPLDVVKSIHYDFSGVFRTAFRLGQHNFALGNVALDRLLVWYKQMPADVAWPLLETVVPCLDAYLRNQFVVGDSFHAEKRKLKTYRQVKLEVELEPELVLLQHKVLKFLAILPNEICLRLNATSSEMRLCRSDTQLLKINLPFGERSVGLCLDPFVDRVLVLSLECADVKVRVTACELLHSIVTIFLGQSAVMTSTSDFDPQLVKILTAILQLASSQDTTIVQLFNPLVLQMSHWYSHPKHCTTTHSDLFIKALMIGVSNENDGAVRDLSGSVLREFVAWTRKQNTKTSLKQNLQKIKLIIDHLKQFCLHPDEAKRYGATVIFNNIYRELREEDAFVDAFWLEILYSFIMNLSLVAPTTTSDDNLLKELNLCLDRVKRVFLEKHNLFSLPRSQRSTPPKFNGNTFNDAALFLLEHTHQINLHCRTKSMEIMKKIPQPVLATTLKEFNIAHYTHDIDNITDIHKATSIEAVLNFFASLTCFIDGHVFIMEVGNIDCSESKLWALLKNLINAEFKALNLTTVTQNLNIRNDVLVRRIKDEFVYCRSKLVEKVLQLIEVMLLKPNLIKSKLIGYAINENTLQFIGDYLFDYRDLGLRDLPHRKWEDGATKLLKLILNYAETKPEVVKCITLICNKKIEEINLMDIKPEVDIKWSQQQALRGLIILARLSNKVLKFNGFEQTSPIESLNNLLGFNKMEDSEVLTIPKLKDSQREFFTLGLELMLNEHFNLNYLKDFDDFVNFLCSERVIYSSELKSELKQGFYVFLLFKKIIFKHTLRENKVYDTLTSISKQSSVDTCVKYFKEYFKYVYNTPDLKTNYNLHKELVKCLEFIWPKPNENTTIPDSVCMELIYDLRLIVDELTCEVMFQTVVAVLNKQQSSDVQQIQHLVHVVRVLGMVAPRGLTHKMAAVLETLKNDNLHHFIGESKRVSTTLFIKTLFNAANYSFCLNMFTSALDLWIILENNLEVNAEFCRDFVQKLSKDLQLDLVNYVYSMKFLRFKQNVVLRLCLSNLLAYCQYEVFETFYSQYIASILEDLQQDKPVLDKTLSCILTNRLFGNIDIERINDQSCKITQAACVNIKTGKKLVQHFAGILFDLCKDVYVDNNDSYGLEEFRLYQCYAYNALTTFVCNNRIVKQEVYQKLFTRIGSNKEDILWCKLVPSYVTFDFDIFGDILKKKKSLSDIRSKKLTNAEEPSDYIESQNLFMSTLSEDITNYDFTNVCVRSADGASGQSCNNKMGLSLEIDDVDINNHECMLQICGVIKHMYENNLLDAEGTPPWICDVGSFLLKDTTPLNIRQFLCKVIENSQNYLTNHANFLIPGIIRTMIHCQSLNSLVTDCLVMLLTTWSDHVPTNEEVMLLIKFVMQNLWNDRTEVFKYNVNLLKTAVEHYNSLVSFTTDDCFVCQLFCTDRKDKANLRVIHIVNILLVNNIAPFPAAPKEFFNKMSNLLLDEKNSQMSKATAETLGLCLKYLEQENSPYFIPERNKLKAGLKFTAENFVSILEGIVKHFPDFGGLYVNNSQWHVILKTDVSVLAFLRILLKCIDSVNDVTLNQLLSLTKWLTSTKLDIVVVCLEVILKAVDAFRVDKAVDILEKVVDLPQNAPVCRLVRIDIIIAFYERFNKENDEKSLEIVKKLKEPLINGFVDGEPDIRKKVYDFWTGKCLLPNGLEDRLLFLLNNLYDESNEELYLLFCNHLILHEVRDVGEPIFKVPLHKCEFKDFKVSSFWRGRSVAMLPLFTSSSTTQSQFVLRATQSYEFARTQLSTQRENFSQTPSGMSFGDLSRTFDGNAMDTNESVFKNPNDFNINTYKVKKYRFFKNKADISISHAIRETKKGQSILKQKQDAKSMKELQVKIYRKYRTGDYPDIQIGIKGIVNTLKELSKNDGEIAQLLFKLLFNSIVDIATNENFVSECTKAIENIFASTLTYNPICTGGLLQIALEHKQTMRFEPDLIKTVAIKSGNVSYGCLLLEEYLISGGCDESFERPCKKSKTTEAGEGLDVNVIPKTILCYLRLGDLYKKIEEWDCVHGIFSSKMSCGQNVLDAIKAESENAWDKARKCYLQLIQSDNDVNRKDFYYEAFFKCSEELADWKMIEKRCEETTQSDSSNVFDNLYASDWNKEVLLPYYIKALVRIQDSTFEEVVQKAMKDGVRKTHLRNQFSNELALMYLDKSKKKLAGNYADHYLKRFLKLWIYTKPSYLAVRDKLLLDMKNCGEISVLCGLYDMISKTSYESVIEELETLWVKSSALDNAIPTQHLTTRITLRDSFVNLIKFKLQTLELNDADEDRIIKKLTDMSLDAEVNVVQQALKQNNFALAKLYAKKNFMRTDPENRPAMTCFLYSKVALLQQGYLSAFKGHKSCVAHPDFGNDPLLMIQAALHFMDLCKTVASVAEQLEESLEKFLPFVGDVTVNSFGDLVNIGFENLRNTLFKFNQQDVCGQQLADAFLCLANECSNKEVKDVKGFIECSLKSMQYGSEKARLVFPKLLAVDGLLQRYQAQFIDQTSCIPTYMFISWIPQLLAYCDTDKVSVVKHIVLNIAKEYPNSIIYAYKLSKEKFTYSFNETRELTYELDELLQNDLVNKMLSALKYVAVPSTIIRNAISKLRKACTESEEQFRERGKQVATLFDSEEDPMLQGDCYSQVITYKKQFLAIINCSKFDKDVILKKLSEIVPPNAKTSTDLQRYSPWLNYFHSSDYEQEIEVPGCYTGHCRPLPHYHPKISKFSTDVIVLESLFKPIRITIYANDVKEYRFLVKYGEDLRQDQRIQQLFKLMNVALLSDVKCRERKLQVSTFEVIPLTGDLGFIQWVDETEILRKVLVNRCGYNRIDIKMNQLKEKLQNIRIKHVQKDISGKYQQLVNEIPWDVLRKSLWNLSPDPDTYFALRMTFIRSYAVMCITNWLLGIGDRHLDNILLNLNTGAVIGIDFGHAFGSATQQQLIPELVPFRLTPQILNVMMPLKESGLLYQTMVHTLRVLRENHETLLLTMDIFIVEPTLNWLTYSGDKWNPEVIMKLARDKFNGKNPIHIMIEEIKARQNDSSDVNKLFVDCLQNVLASTQNCDGEDAILNVPDQVKCLIAHASDPNLLGRMFYGWDPCV